MLQVKTAYNINMVCGSGLKSVIDSYTDIIAGMADIVLASAESQVVLGLYCLELFVRAIRWAIYKTVNHMVSRPSMPLIVPYGHAENA